MSISQSPPIALPLPLHNKQIQLEAHLKSLLATHTVAIAYSGGLDSRFLAHMAARVSHEYALPTALLLHATGPHVPAAETAGAKAWAMDNELPITLLDVNPLHVPEVLCNDKTRCYHCKKYIFTTFFTHIRQLDARAVLCDGSNASDREGYRPGRQALTELGVVSPLDAAHLTKADIHALASATSLADPAQRARPCLLTRLAYGLAPTPQRLHEVALLETRVETHLAMLSAKLDSCPPDYRIRMTPDETFLQLEPCPAAIEAGLHLALPTTRIVVTETLSGYFDRTTPAP